jgi:hypothetical protein
MTAVKCYPPNPYQVYFFSTCLVDLFYLEGTGWHPLFAHSVTPSGRSA